MPANNRALKVFLCHANEDKSKVRKLHRFLVSNGIDAWLDEENLRPGQEWRVEIPKVVREADVVVICISSVSARKEGFVQAEINFALDKAKEKPEGKIYIIPAKLEECAIPDKLSRWQWVNLFEKDGCQKLMDTLSFCAREIDVTMPQISAQGNSESVQRKVAKKPQRNLRSQKNSNAAQARYILKIEAGEQSIIVVGPVVGSNLISGDGNEVGTSGNNAAGSGKKIENSIRSERRVSNRVLLSWLKGHGLEDNPFGKADLKSHLHYPDGTARPDRWDAFLDPVPSFACCPTPEDAQAISNLLWEECLSLSSDAGSGQKQWVFPLRASHQQAVALQSPLQTLVHSAAQTWLDYLPKNPSKLHGMPQLKQSAVLELLYWSLGSANSIINLLQDKGLDDDKNGLSLILKIEKFAKEFSMPTVPGDAILHSWLRLRPQYYNSTYLILCLDALPISTRSLWLEQVNLLIPALSVSDIVMKMISSVDLSGEFLLSTTQLDWSDAQLLMSLYSLFDHASESAADPKGPKEKKVKFIELFGSGPFGCAETDEHTTDRLISASRNSLARMLILGNRLLQYHCEKRGISEKYLYVEDLEYILSIA